MTSGEWEGAKGKAEMKKGGSACLSYRREVQNEFGGPFQGLEGGAGRIRQPGGGEGSGSDRADAVVNAAKPGVAARTAPLPEVFKLPEDDELFICPALASMVGDLAERTDKFFMSAA